MTEFWESSFRERQEMWGMEPAGSAVEAAELFKEERLRKVLIPGFGYGRNAKVFLDAGCDVTGIEISETAIELAKSHFGDSVHVHHGSVGLMPFDDEVYDGIYCYSLLHLLSSEERKKLIQDCYSQLRSGGIMVFVSISKGDFRYRGGVEVATDTFEMNYGVTLFFYDEDSIEADFGRYGLMEVLEEGSVQKFWRIICKK